MPDSVPRSGWLRPAKRYLVALGGALLFTLSSQLAPVHATEQDSDVVTAPQNSTSAKSDDDQSKTRFVVTKTDGDGLRVRKSPGLQSEIITRIPEGTVIALRDGVAKEKDDLRWLPIKTATTSGWAAARYLQRVVPHQPILRKIAPDAPVGERAVAVAESQLGRPYVWGGTSPSGFDCSGFAQWVYSQAGLKIPRLVRDQIEVGKQVGIEALKPGDLIAFENTYTDGLSHVGVYQGNNRFIHAADEARGVTISNLLDDYWKPRLVKAVRLK